MSSKRSCVHVLVAGILTLCLSLPALAESTSAYTANEFTATAGEALYQHICQGCHMPEGRGASRVGEYPALAANPTIASSAYVTQMVLYGNRGMPGFGAFLSDEQVAALVNYVRHSFGNDFPGRIAAKDVAKARQSDLEYDPLE